jgi:cytochrome P450
VEFVEDLSSLARCVVPSAILLRLFPPFLHPLLSRITHIFNLIYKRKVMKRLRPYVKEKIAVAEHEIAEGRKPSDENLLDWIITDELCQSKTKKTSVNRICNRIFVAAFASMETTTLTMTNTLFDLATSKPYAQYWEGLKEEVDKMFSRCGIHPEQSDVLGLVRVDSALKETLRLRTSIKALAMQVISPEGLIIQGDVKLPYGSRISIPSYGVHLDEDVYPDATQYDAFRFSRKTEATEDGATASCTSQDSMVSACAEYLPFGMGRHSCPGRFFASAELKLFLAYVTKHYDIKFMDTRPKFNSVGHFPIPPLTETIWIRRKAAT